MSIVQIDAKIAELAGIHIGDGCISVTKRYKEYALCGDINEEREYYDMWVMPLFNEKIALPLLGCDVVAKENPSNGVYGIYVFEPKVVEFFQNLGFQPGSKRDILIPSKFLNDHLVKRLLRGIFDTDGTIYFERNYSAKSPRHIRPKIKLGTTSKRLARQILNVLRV